MLKLTKNILLASVLLCLAVVELTAEEKQSSQNRVTVYLKSGEVINGNLETDSADEIRLNKFGSVLTIKKALIERVADYGEKPKRKYSFKTAVIHYKGIGMVGEEDSTLYVDAEKDLKVMESSQTFPFDTKTKRKIIEKEDGLYMIESDSKFAVKLPFSGAYGGIISEDLYQGRQFEQEDFLSKPCRVYNLQAPLKGKIYFWEGLLLKMDSGKGSIGLTKKAVKIEIDVPIDPAVFEWPKDLEIISTSEYGEKIAGKFADMEFKDPKLLEMKKEQIEGTAAIDKEFAAKIDRLRNSDGSYDMVEAGRLLKERENKELLEKGRKYGASEEILKGAQEDSLMGRVRLQSFVLKQEQELREKSGELIEAANTLEQQGDFTKALEYLNKAIDLLPDHFAYRQRFQLHKKLNNPEKALEDINSALTTTTFGFTSFNTHLYRERAELLDQLGRYQEAVDDYTLIIKKEEKNFAKRNKEREDRLKKIGVDTIPDPKPDWGLLSAYQDRAKCYMALKMYDQALADIDQALKYKPSKYQADRIKQLQEVIRLKKLRQQ